MGKYFFLLFLFIIGCITKPVPPPEPPIPKKAQQETFQEKAQKHRKSYI
jgi:hypothetical protein